MNTTRLEAFSDGVLAIVITIMVLELKVPSGANWSDLEPLAPTLFAYILSFIFVGIYWNNHHHMLHTVERVRGEMLWANSHLLFWLSLSPLTTAWVGQSHFAALPVAFYSFVLLMSAVAYSVLQRVIIADQGPGSPLAAAVGRDVKGISSIAFYALAIPLAFFMPYASILLIILVAILWIKPDRRIERRFADSD